jgi:hypothetical protein
VGQEKARNVNTVTHLTHVSHYIRACEEYGANAAALSDAVASA